MSDGTDLKFFILHVTAFESYGDTLFDGSFLCPKERISSISQLSRPVIPLEPQDSVQEGMALLGFKGNKRKA